MTNNDIKTVGGFPAGNAYVTVSGEPVQFENGAKRDSEGGKINIGLVPLSFLHAWYQEEWDVGHIILPELVDLPHRHGEALQDHIMHLINLTCYTEYKDCDGEVAFARAVWRLAALLTRGAAHYGDDNWKAGMPYTRVIRSLQRHAVQWVAQIDTEEDHFAAVLFNLMVLWFYEDDDNLKQTWDDRA